MLNAISLILECAMAKNIAMNVTLPTVDRMGDLARWANGLSVVQLMHMEGRRIRSRLEARPLLDISTK